jgi:hypothetical protein
VLAALPLLREGDPFGPLHIAIEDWNLDDDNIAFCLKESEGHPDHEIALALSRMSLPERATALALADGYLATCDFECPNGYRARAALRKAP